MQIEASPSGDWDGRGCPGPAHGAGSRGGRWAVGGDILSDSTSLTPVARVGQQRAPLHQHQQSGKQGRRKGAPWNLLTVKTGKEAGPI